MFGLDAGQFAQCLGHRKAMAGGVIAFVAQQGDRSGQFLREQFQQIALLLEVLAEILEELLVVAVVAQLMPDVLG